MTNTSNVNDDLIFNLNFTILVRYCDPCKNLSGIILGKLLNYSTKSLHTLEAIIVEINLQLKLLTLLAHLVMSLCNHTLSIVWCCHCHQCQHRHLCTALPVTALIIETSYLANICSYTPSICT